MIDLQYELRVTDLASLSDDEMNLLVDTIFDARRAEFSGVAPITAGDVPRAADRQEVLIETMEIRRDHPADEPAQDFAERQRFHTHS